MPSVALHVSLVADAANESPLRRPTTMCTSPAAFARHVIVAKCFVQGADGALGGVLHLRSSSLKRDVATMLQARAIPMQGPCTWKLLTAYRRTGSSCSS